MAWHECEECGRMAVWRKDNEPWKTKCSFCWKQGNGYDLSPGERYALELEVELVEARAVAKKKTAPPCQFSPQELTQLLRLCHPDRHGNSALSNEITRRIIDIRRGK
jgi:hypothetical protein